MPKNYRKKKMMRRRARPARRARRSAVGNTDRHFKIKTTVDYGFLQTDGNGKFLGTYAGNLTELDDSPGNNYNGIGQQTALRSMYEEYRIDAVKFVFVPVFTQNNAGGVGGGQVTYAINKSPDSTASTQFIDVLRQNDCKVQNTTKGFAVTVRRPMWSVIAPLSSAIDHTVQLQSAVSTATHSWVSTRGSFGPSTVPQPNWFGLDVAVESASVGTQLYRVFKTYYVSFRSQT